MTLNRRHALVAAALPAWHQARAQRVTRRVRFEIDMRDAIREGVFKPATDRVGVRGAALPLSWQKTALATEAAPGIYALELDFERMADGGQAVQYKFRIDRSGLGQDEGWETGPNRSFLPTEASQTVARRFNEPQAMPPVQRTGQFVLLGGLT
jgi:hypothetical protein